MGADIKEQIELKKVLETNMLKMCRLNLIESQLRPACFPGKEIIMQYELLIEQMTATFRGIPFGVDHTLGALIREPL